MVSGHQSGLHTGFLAGGGGGGGGGVDAVCTSPHSFFATHTTLIHISAYFTYFTLISVWPQA